MVGQTLSNYHILEQYTQGGMEEVYLAEDIREHRKVVLKVLPTSVRRDPERMQRIKNDVEAATKLHHPTCTRRLLGKDRLPVRVTWILSAASCGMNPRQSQS